MKNMNQLAFDHAYLSRAEAYALLKQTQYVLEEMQEQLTFVERSARKIMEESAAKLGRIPKCPNFREPSFDWRGDS